MKKIYSVDVVWSYGRVRWSGIVAKDQQEAIERAISKSKVFDKDKNLGKIERALCDSER
jgi:hypothetical protein